MSSFLCSVHLNAFIGAILLRSNDISGSRIGELSEILGSYCSFSSLSPTHESLLKVFWALLGSSSPMLLSMELSMLSMLSPESRFVLMAPTGFTRTALERLLAILRTVEAPTLWLILLALVLLDAFVMLSKESDALDGVPVENLDVSVFWKCSKDREDCSLRIASFGIWRLLNCRPITKDWVECLPASCCGECAFRIELVFSVGQTEVPIRLTLGSSSS
mmetsp:Transcript_7700/g.11345  ORF Transcript_7700/g.11345 Transcript_7700/m.11345 type:complete len:219 (-) Transcript_7700:1117-1773(-)